MNAVDLIIKKRNGETLSTEEINAFVAGVTDGSWPDYQTAAMLMALFLRGLDDQEISDLTLAMARSGEQIDLTDIPGIKVDKHSTGGVADTTTLILVPLVASCGVPVIKLSGRGLGFTGGTIDKLSSIPGFQVELPAARALELAQSTQAVILAQSGNLTPADKKLYALRDVTGTVDSIPLIAASIMSKKIAAGTDAIVLDVKCGSGSFMPELQDARQLAEVMVRIGRLAGKRVAALITAMNQPLGRHVGNSLEVIEAIEVLKNRSAGDLVDVTLGLGAYMLLLAGRCSEPNEARALLKKQLSSGAGLKKLSQIIAGQGGNPAVIDDYGLFAQPACRLELRATRSGWLTQMDTAAIGHAFVTAGGGRLAKDDPIDSTAGFILPHRLGDPIEKGALIAEIQAADPAKAAKAKKMLQQAIQIGPQKPLPQPVILDAID